MRQRELSLYDFQAVDAGLALLARTTTDIAQRSRAETTRDRFAFAFTGWLDYDDDTGTITTD